MPPRVLLAVVLLAAAGSLALLTKLYACQACGTFHRRTGAAAERLEVGDGGRCVDFAALYAGKSTRTACVALLGRIATLSRHGRPATPTLSPPHPAEVRPVGLTGTTCSGGASTGVV